MRGADLLQNFDPPKHLGFRHSMFLRNSVGEAGIDAQIRYTLEPVEQGISVIRDLDLTIQTPRLSGW